MASKQKLQIKRLNQTVDGYAHNDFLGLYLDPEDNLWRAVHIASGSDLEGPTGTWRKKRACLAFISGLENMDWNIMSEAEMLDKNGGWDSVVEIYKAAVELGREAE